MGADRVVPGPRAEPGSRLVPAARPVQARRRRRGDLLAHARLLRRDRVPVRADARPPGERVREQAPRLRPRRHARASIAKGVITIVVATITIAFMTFFMLLEGPVWVDRFYCLLPESSQPRWRQVGFDIYRTVGGYVTGNLLISLIAGGLTTVVLLIMGVPFAVALGLIVAVLDLIPLAGATIAAILIGIVAFLHSIVAGVVV
ncbi:MAG: AI-2E family transporter, partial [Chloroflexi bacterium]